MNQYSKLLQQSLDELDKWVSQQPSPNPTNTRFYEGIKNLLKDAVNSHPQNVGGIVKTILRLLVDSAPVEMLQESVLPSFHQVASATQRKKKNNLEEL